MPSSALTDAHVLVPWTTRGTVTVELDGRYVWSFTAPRDGRLARDGRRVSWPPALQTRLRGSTTARLALGDRTLFEGPVAFRGCREPLVLQDTHGHQLAVDKAGHVTRVFAQTDAAVRRHVAEAAGRALSDLRAEGHDAHLTYGCLLGAVRDGRMIGHDSDADLGYLSEHTSPADVIRESYRMERAMRRRGWRVIRMSGADLKLLEPLPDGRTVHIDVFGGFHVDDTFYLLGGRSGRLPREALTPARPVVLEGVELLGPARPDLVLEFLYGPDWRIPDPAFRSEDPAAGVRRLDEWLRGCRTDVPAWNELYRDPARRVPPGPTPFARWVDARLPDGAGVAEIGSGTGRDAAWFHGQGRAVRAYDFAGAAIRQTRRRLARAGATGDPAAALALNDRRSVLVAGAELARTPSPLSLYARGLVGCLDAEALDHLMLLSSMALRRGGMLLLEFPATGTSAPSAPAPLHRRVDPETVRAAVEARGGTVDHLEVGPGTDFFDQPDPRVARLVARWTSRETR